MKKVLAAAALALSVALAAPALAQPTGMQVVGLLYSNFVGVYADDLEDFEVVVRIRNRLGVIAEMDVVIPDGTPDNTFWPFYFTDWGPKAAYLGLQPGYVIEVEFREKPALEAPGIVYRHRISNMRFTRMNPDADVLAGFVRPPPPSGMAFGGILGLRLDPSGPPTSDMGDIFLGARGGFVARLAGEVDLLRNSLVFLGYEWDDFLILYNRWVPGLLAVKDTSYGLMTGNPAEHHRAFLRNRSGRLKAIATEEPLETLGVGLLQFNRWRRRVPIRSMDRIFLADRSGFSDRLLIPRDFGVTRTMSEVFPPSADAGPAFSETTGFVFSAPVGQYVCVYFSGPGAFDTSPGCGIVPPPGELVVTYTPPLDITLPQPVALMVMQSSDGDFIVDHEGVEDILGYLLGDLLGSLFTP